MLYAGCSVCQRVVPLLCGGQLFPHLPLDAIQTPFGVGCPICGVTPPIFTCLTCFTTQRLYVPGAQFPIAAVQAQGQMVAPVAQAPSGANESTVKTLLKESAKSFAVQFGKAAASHLVNSMEVHRDRFHPGWAHRGAAGPQRRRRARASLPRRRP